MTTAECIVLVVLAGLVALLVIGVRKLERKQQEWEWLHPPEDDDGVSILKDQKEADE